jgi:hypothetical protein
MRHVVCLICGIFAVTQPFVARAADAPSWPCYQGPNGNFSATDCGLTLVDDLKDARLLWKSHEPDSQHGSVHDVLILGTTADTFKPMGKPWNTPHYDAKPPRRNIC